MRVVVPFLIITCLFLSGCSHYVQANIVHNSIGNLRHESPVIVLGFSDLEYGSGNLYDSRGGASIVSQYFEIHLAQNGFTVVNRNNLKNVFDEQTLQYSGLTDGQIVKLGKLIGARAVVTGSVQRWNRYCDLYGCTAYVIFSTKMVDVETARVVFSSVSKMDEPIERSREDVANFLVEQTVRKMVGH